MSKSDVIKNSIIDSYRYKIDDLLSFCESEIEKIMLLRFYEYFDSYIVKPHNLEYGPYGVNLLEVQEHKKFSDITLITSNISEDEIAAESSKILAERVKKYHYKKIGSDYEKIIGFKAEEQLPDLRFEGKFDKDIYRTFAVYPQYNVDLGVENFRLDIAVFLYCKKGSKIIETKQIAIECDGYDFHSSKEQKKNDDIRTRKLKRNGWREVLRYSGTELYQIEDKEEFNQKFEEIIDILTL